MGSGFTGSSSIRSASPGSRCITIEVVQHAPHMTVSSACAVGVLSRDHSVVGMLCEECLR